MSQKNPFDDPNFGAPQGQDKAANPFSDPEFGKPSGALRRAGDLALGFTSGALGATKGITDAFGADNAASRGLASAQKFVDSGLTREAQAAQSRQTEILESAKDKGFMGQVAAGGRAFMEAPVQTAAMGLGSVVPFVAASLIPGGQVATAARLGMGVGMGAGIVKGSIYEDQVKRGIESGMTEDQAKAAAQEAQAYAGPNKDQIALGGALGVADAAFGLTPAVTQAVRKTLGKEAVKTVGKQAAEETALKAATMGALKEMPTEFTQGTQEQVAANVAAQRAGYEAGTFEGAFSQGALEAFASGGPGAAFGVYNRERPTQQPPAADPDTDPTQPPLALGFNPKAGTHTVFPDGSVILNSETPAGEQAVFDKRYAPQAGLTPAQKAARLAELEQITKGTPDQTMTTPDGQSVTVPGQKPRYFTEQEQAEYRALRRELLPATPSQAMGMDPAAGPMSAAAATAVDGGASAQVQQAQALAAAAEAGPKTKTLDEATPEERAAYDAAFFDPTKTKQGVADRRKAAIEGMLERAAIQGENQPSQQPTEDFDVPFGDERGQPDAARGFPGDEGATAGLAQAGATQADAEGVSGPGAAADAGQPQRFAALNGQQPQAQATTGQKVKSLKEFMAKKRAEREAQNVQDPTPGTAGAQTQTTAGQAPQTVGGQSASAAAGVPAAGTAGVEAAGVGLAWSDMTPDQRKRSRLEQEIASGTTNNGGVVATLRPSAIAKRKQELEAMADAGLTAEASTKKPNSSSIPVSPNLGDTSFGDAQRANPNQPATRSDLDRLTIPDMTDAQLQSAVSIYGEGSKRATKAAAELKRRQGTTQPATTPKNDGTPSAQTQQAEAQGPQAPAAPAAVAGDDEQGAQWDRMTTTEREAVATRAGLNKVAVKNLARRGWQGLDKTQQQNLRKGFGAGKAAEAAAEQQPAAEEPNEVVHNGARIYRTRTKVGDEVKTMWAVESPENKARRAAGERTLGGDTLHDTIEQAKASADREAKQFADRKAFAEQQDAEERARKEAEEARKASNRGKSILERRKDAVLDGPTKLPASAGLGNTTRRNAMQMAVEQGRAVVERQVDDSAAKKRDQEAVDRVRRAGYMLGLSNENIPVVKAGLEAQARLKANDYKKPEYRVYGGSDPTGSFHEITKTEYEYAQELMAKKAQEPVAAPAQAPQSDEFLPDGWTKSVNGYTKRPVYRMEQEIGQPFAVVTQTEGMTYEVQIRHGDKQLTASTQRGALSEVLAGAKAELAKMTQAASVTHQDPGEKPEAATKGVVSDSLKTAARNEGAKPSEMRKWLLAEIDKELLRAPDRADYDEAVKRMGEKDAISMFTGSGFLGKNAETGFITFDVPGDGKFKVRNSVRGLLEFRKTVMASPGFKDSGQRTKAPEQNDGAQDGSGSKSAAVLNMIEEGDFEAARDYAEAVDINLEDVKVPRGERKPQWEKFLKDGTLPPAAWMPSKEWQFQDIGASSFVPDSEKKSATLTRVADGSTYVATVKGSLDNTSAKYTVTKDGKEIGRSTTRAPFSETLRMAEDAMPEANDKPAPSKASDTGWNMAGTGYGGKRYRGRNITLDDGREVVARIYENAGNYDEVEVKVDGARKFTARDSFNAQDKADAFIKTLAAQEVGPFGPILTQYRGDAKGAIKALTALKDGEAVAALNHPDVGDIDLVWGKEGTAAEDYEDGMGLAKIIKKHSEVLDDLQGFVSSLSVQKRSENRVILANRSGRALVRLDWDGKAKHWLLTAYDDEKKASVANEGRTGVSAGADSAPPAEQGTEAGQSVAQLPEGYKPAGEPFYRDGKLTQGYAPFDLGQRVTMKESGGQSGVIESLTSPDDAGVFSGALVKFDNGSTQIVKLNKLEAADAPDQQADAPKLTQAEAKELMEWQDLGQKDGIKTHILTFYASKADKDANRGRMTVATVTKEADSKNWVVDGTDERMAMLGMAKKKAETAGMAKAVADGFVEPAQPTEAPAQPKTVKQGITNARAKKAAEAEAQRAEYFAQGNILKGYGGHDRVLEYTPPDENGRWSVRVQRVVKQGEQWVDAPNERPRWHSTPPEAKELAAGPVDTVPVITREQEKALYDYLREKTEGDTGRFELLAAKFRRSADGAASAGDRKITLEWLQGMADDGDARQQAAAEGEKQAAERAEQAQRASDDKAAKQLAELKAGRSQNPNYQAFLDTLEQDDLDAVTKSAQLNVRFMAFVSQRQAEFEKAGGGSSPEAFAKFVRDYADKNLASRLRKGVPPAGAKAGDPARIADFGEKIGGARKDVWTGFKDDLTAVSDDDIAGQPLTKVWPAPDYQKLIDSGMDPEVVAFVRAARDEVPAKPRSSWKVKRWAEQVKALRGFALSMMDGSITIAEARRSMGHAKALSRGMDGFLGRIDLYKEVGHGKSLEGVRFSLHNYTLYRGEENVTLWVVEKDAASSVFGNFPREIATGKTKEEALQDFKAKYATLDLDKAVRQASFDIVSKPGIAGYFIAKKVGRNYATMEGPFATLKEAREYRQNNLTALQDKLEKFKEIPRERADVNQPRVGVDMRNGQDVTPEMFGEVFGFRGVEFGNWVEQKRRQKDLNDAFDALMDMAAVLNIPAKAISLNGRLGLAFGARGSGGVNPAAAHYEPDNVVINLTKKEGAGSLGHEWWHALDNYFSKQRKQGADFMTEALDVKLAARSAKYQPYDGVRKEMIEAFGAVVRSISQTAMKARSDKLDGKRSKEYWTTGAEMSARAFESYLISKLQDQNASNDYLANVVSQETWDAMGALGIEMDDSYPYPTAGEIPVIRAGFDLFFQTVQARETDADTIELYRTTRAPGLTANTQLSQDAVKQSVASALKRVVGAPPVQVVRRPEDLGIPNPFAPAVPKGVTLEDGSIVVFSDGAESVVDVFRTVFHELFHRGTKVRFTRNPDYITKMLEIAAADPMVQAEVEAWKKSDDAKDKWAEFKERGPMTGERLANFEALAVEEALATMAERIGMGELSQPQSLVQKLARFLGKVAESWGMGPLALWLRNQSATSTERFVMDTLAMSGGTPGRATTARMFNARQQAELASLFDALQAPRGVELARAQRQVGAHPMAQAIREVEATFLDTLAGLDDAKLIQINC